MGTVIPFPGRWKGAGRAPNDARCCSEARAVACGNCSSHWICSWHGDRHAPDFVEPKPPPAPPSRPPDEAPARSALSASLPPGARMDDSEGVLCPDCNGTGRVHVTVGPTPETTWCRCCDGRGTVLRCPTCDGTGDCVPTRPDMGRCPDCDGTGADIF